jgi:hypothetical protein
VELLGRLGAEAGAWRTAWRARRDNPLAASAALAYRRAVARRPAWLPCSPFMCACLLLVSAATTYLLGVAWLRFDELAASLLASRGFALRALGWAGVQLLESSAVLVLLWLGERLALSFRYATVLLATHHGARGGLSPELAASGLSDHDVVVGALQHLTRLCWPPLLLLAVLDVLVQFIYASDLLTSPVLAAVMHGRQTVQLAWFILLMLLALLLKPLCGLLAVWAGGLLLLCLGPWWRSAPLAYGAAALALAWQAPGLACALPGQLGGWVLYASRYALVWRTCDPAVMALLPLLLLLLSLAALRADPLRAYAYWARRGMPAMRPLLACAIAAALFAGVVILCAQLAPANPYSGSRTPPWLAQLGYWLWPALTTASACPLPLQDMARSYAAGKLLSEGFVNLGLRWAVLGGTPLALALLFAAQARAAVCLRRRVLG